MEASCGLAPQRRLSLKGSEARPRLEGLGLMGGLDGSPRRLPSELCASNAFRAMTPPERRPEGGLGSTFEKPIKRFGEGFGVAHCKGDLMDYSQATCWVYRAAHTCLWDWELRRQPEGLWLRN